MKYVNSKPDMIDGPHFAIIEFSSIHIPGDERSRTNPGHGYPASTEPVVKYIAFTNEEEWKEKIIERSNRSYGNDFMAIHVDRIANITKTFNIE